MTRGIQSEINAIYYRGGSSRAPFFHIEDIPAAGPVRDSVLTRLMGSPDPLQIDGMGGTKITTSKIAIIGPPTHPEADVDYTFVQVGISDGTISYNGNCGNISSAVGPFAIDQKMVKTFRPGVSPAKGIKTQEVKIWQTGTKKLLITHVPLDDEGRVIIDGDFSIAGVPGTGAPLLMDFRNTIGAARSNGVLPTGNPVDTVTLESGKEIQFSIVDVANIFIYVRASDFGVDLKDNSFPNLSKTSPDEINANASLIASLKELRGKATQKLGMCQHWQKVDEESPFLPGVMLVDTPPPASATDAIKGPPGTEGGAHISARLILGNACHPSMAGTGACCLTTATCTPGTIANSFLTEENRKSILSENKFRIAQPEGIMPVTVVLEDGTGIESGKGEPRFKTLAFIRTARKIMQGQIYVPWSAYDVKAATNGA